MFSYIEYWKREVDVGDGEKKIYVSWSKPVTGDIHSIFALLANGSEWYNFNLHPCILRCVMCHKSLCHIKNNVPHIYRKYYLKKFSRLVSSKSAELTSKILSCEGRDLLLQLQLYRQLCPTQERIFEVNSADFEDTNLEIFFTEYLLYMCGTLFLMWQGDSWHMTHLNEHPLVQKFLKEIL